MERFCTAQVGSFGWWTLCLCYDLASHRLINARYVLHIIWTALCKNALPLPQETCQSFSIRGYLICFCFLSRCPILSAFLVPCMHAGRLPPHAADTVHYLHAHTNQATRRRKLRHCACSSGHACQPQRASWKARHVGTFPASRHCVLLFVPLRAPSTRGAKFLLPWGRGVGVGLAGMHVQGWWQAGSKLGLSHTCWDWGFAVSISALLGSWPFSTEAFCCTSPVQRFCCVFTARIVNGWRDSQVQKVAS